MKKVILDVDTGIDDALAIVYLLSHKEFEVIGITTGFGNTYEEDVYQNTIDLLNALKRNDVRIYRGATHQLANEVFVREPILEVIHGKNGIGEVEFEHVTRKPEELSAAEFMAKSAREFGRDLRIITLGAMNNLLEAIHLDKEAICNVDSITAMGGALTLRGNCNHYAEANFLRDPDATIAFFKEEVPFAMVPLDVTFKTLITEKDLGLWKQYDNVVAKALLQMVRYYYANEGDSAEELSGCLHDPLAVEVALNPEIVTQYFNCDLMAEEGAEDLCRVVQDPNKLISGKRIVKVALDARCDEFVSKFVNKIGATLSALE